ncbi:MAG TPA: DUF4239 domain-containing protein [Gemmatales bacterium]|nr:DUF4239 domain-containing protein [Gemmatales bacterium]
MPSLTIAVISFACVFSGVLAGFFLRTLLPQHHLKDDSKEIVKLGSGLIATMAALVLGLLVSSAKSSFDTLNDSVKQAGAKLLLLDQLLSEFGPEAKPTRLLLRQTLENLMDVIWPSGKKQSININALENTTGMKAVADNIRTWKPTNDPQQLLKSQALQLINEMAQTRWSVIEHSQNSIPLPFLVILIFWLTMLYLSIGLLAPCNATVVTVLLICALSVSSAIFLIHEMNHPFQGIIQLSRAPFDKALEHLGK